MALEFKVKGVRVQLDKLKAMRQRDSDPAESSQDLDWFDVVRFKRAKVPVLFYDDGKKVKVNLYLSLRSGVLTVTTQNDDAPVGEYGLAIVVEWSTAIGEEDLWNTIEDVSKARGTAHFTVRDREGFLGFLHDLQERGRVRPLWQGF